VRRSAFAVFCHSISYIAAAITLSGSARSDRPYRGAPLGLFGAG
jgi:hypothetical protein